MRGTSSRTCGSSTDRGSMARRRSNPAAWSKRRSVWTPGSVWPSSMRATAHWAVFARCARARCESTARTRASRRRVWVIRGCLMDQMISYSISNVNSLSDDMIRGRLDRGHCPADSCASAGSCDEAWTEPAGLRRVQKRRTAVQQRRGEHRRQSEAAERRLPVSGASPPATAEPLPVVPGPASPRMMVTLAPRVGPEDRGEHACLTSPAGRTAWRVPRGSSGLDDDRSSRRVVSEQLLCLNPGQELDLRDVQRAKETRRRIGIR